MSLLIEKGIFQHLKLEIAQEIPASNVKKY